MCNSSAGVKKFYYYCLIFKLVVGAFIVPLVIIKMISDKENAVGISEAFCHNDDVKLFNACKARRDCFLAEDHKIKKTNPH